MHLKEAVLHQSSWCGGSAPRPRPRPLPLLPTPKMTVEALLTCPACCRWHFAVLGWKDGPGYLYNGLALLVSFVVSRVILYGLGLLHLLKLRYVPHYDMGEVTWLLPTSSLTWHAPCLCIKRCRACAMQIVCLCMYLNVQPFVLDPPLHPSIHSLHILLGPG